MDRRKFLGGLLSSPAMAFFGGFGIGKLLRAVTKPAPLPTTYVPYSCTGFPADPYELTNVRCKDLTRMTPGPGPVFKVGPEWRSCSWRQGDCTFNVWARAVHMKYRSPFVSDYMFQYRLASCSSSRESRTYEQALVIGDQLPPIGFVLPNDHAVWFTPRQLLSVRGLSMCS